MGNMTQNKSTQNGKQYRSNYHLSFILPTGPLGATIPNTKNNKALAELILKNGKMAEKLKKNNLLKNTLTKNLVKFKLKIYLE